MRGGAAKIKTYPCHCCSISSDELAHFKTNNNRCACCIEQNNKCCGCWEMNDGRNTEVMRRHVINVVNDDQVENETCDGFVENIKRCAKN